MILGANQGNEQEGDFPMESLPMQVLHDLRAVAAYVLQGSQLGSWLCRVLYKPLMPVLLDLGRSHGDTC